MQLYGIHYNSLMRNMIAIRLLLRRGNGCGKVVIGSLKMLNLYHMRIAFPSVKTFEIKLGDISKRMTPIVFVIM